MRSEHKFSIALVVGAVLMSAVAASVASATTGPAPHTLVSVMISDNAVKLSKKQVKDVTFVDFYIHNTGKLAHTLVMGREESVVVKAGQRVHFYVGFPVYGWYRYHVGLHGKPNMKGRFHIDSPQAPD